MKNKVQLRGQCILKFHTGTGAYDLTIKKENLHGQNNADSLINEVLHFAVMRMGTDRLAKLVEEKIAKYNGEYKTQGIFPDDLA